MHKAQIDVKDLATEVEISIISIAANCPKGNGRKQIAKAQRKWFISQ